MSFNLSFKDSKDCSMFRGQAAKNSIDEVQCNSVHVQGLYKNLKIRIFTIIHFFVVSRLKSLILPLSNHQKNKVRKGFQKRILFLLNLKCLILLLTGNPNNDTDKIQRTQILVT